MNCYLISGIHERNSMYIYARTRKEAIGKYLLKTNMNEDFFNKNMKITNLYSAIQRSSKNEN